MIKLKSLLSENYQLATKIYGNVLTSGNIEFLTKLSSRDYTFKTLADLLEEDEDSMTKWNMKQWTSAVNQLRKYNNNVFPIKNFSFDSKVRVVTKKILEQRQEIIEIVASWPSSATRNLKEDIKIPRSNFYNLHNTVEYINLHLQYLNNRSDTDKSMILHKIFSSDHKTFDDVLDFVEDKQNLLNGIAYTKEELYNIVKKNEYYLKIIYDRGNIVIIDVTGQPGIKVIGCNSLWCFTYGNEYGKAGEQWEVYSSNGHVYAIIDFGKSQNSPEFIHILTKPFDEQADGESHLYNMANEDSGEDAKTVITHITKDPRTLKLFTFQDLI